jgi:hypothetical protein
MRRRSTKAGADGSESAKRIKLEEAVAPEGATDFGAAPDGLERAANVRFNDGDASDAASTFSFGVGSRRGPTATVSGGGFIIASHDEITCLGCGCSSTDTPSITAASRSVVENRNGGTLFLDPFSLFWCRHL